MVRVGILAVLLVGCARSAAAPPAAPAPAPAPAAAAVVPLDLSSEDAFRASVRARLLARGEVKSAEPGDEPLVLRVVNRDDHDLGANLHRFWDLCQRIPANCDAEVDALIAALGATADAPPPDRSALVATVRTAEYLAHARQMVPDAWGEPLVGQLAVVYAFDLPDRFVTARKHDLARLGLTEAEAAALARTNTQARLGRIDQRFDTDDPGTAMLIKEGKGLEPGMLLQLDRWSVLATRVSCTLIVAVPENDALIVVCGGPDDVARLRDAVDAILAQAERPLSNQILVWSRDRWAPAP